MRKQYRNEIILAALLLLAALAMFLWQRASRSQTPPMRAQVSVDGEIRQIIDLSQDGEYTIESAGGGMNHLVVKEGQIWCDQASCPDKVCVHQGKQSLEGGTIVCLPNRMIVQILP